LNQHVDPIICPIITPIISCSHTHIAGQCGIYGGSLGVSDDVGLLILASGGLDRSMVAGLVHLLCV